MSEMMTCDMCGMESELVERLEGDTTVACPICRWLAAEDFPVDTGEQKAILESMWEHYQQVCEHCRKLAKVGDVEERLERIEDIQRRLEKNMRDVAQRHLERQGGRQRAGSAHLGALHEAAAGRS